MAPSDILAVLLGLGVASAELASNHNSFTLNNIVACLIATVREELKNENR